MNPRPAISIIMPVYNSRRFVRRAIESMTAQTCGDFEFLIYDDGSSDGTKQILEKCASRDVRIKLHLGEHQGYLNWLREGVLQAQGQHIARMDADDIAMPERLERQLAYLCEEPDCVIVGCQALLIDDAGMPVDRLSLPVEHEQIESELLQGRGGMLLHPSWLVRRDSLIEIGQYREGFESAEDFDVLLRLADRGRLANLPDVLLKYRIHASSVTATRAARQRELKLRSIEETYRRRGLSPQPVDLGKVEPPWAGTFHLKTAARALRAGHRQTARRHALRALLRMPRNRKPWGLLWQSFTLPTSQP